MKTTTRFLRLLAKDKKDLVYLYTYSALQGLINLSLPVGIQAIMSLVLAGRLSASWTILTLIVTGGVILAGVFQILQLYIVEIMQRKLFVRSAFEFAYRIPHFRLRELGSSYPPEIVHRFFDVVGIQKDLNKVLLDSSASALQIIFGLILLSLYHPVFIAFGIVLLLILLLIILLTSKRGLATSIEESNSKYHMAYWLTELARVMPTFKLGGTSELALTRTDELASEYLVRRKRHFRIIMAQLVSIVSLKTLVTGGLLIIGALLLINNSISIGQFVASEIVIILVLNSSEKLINTLQSVYDILTSVEKLGKVTDLPLDDDNSGTVKLPGGKAIGIEVNDLTVYGVMDKKPIIDHLDLRIEPGEHVCISGESGSGKSTLLKTLSSYLDSYEGNIKIDNIPMVNLDLRSYRNVGKVIFSDQEIFHGTLLDNVGLKRPEISTDDIIKMMDRVGLRPLVDRLPNGYFEVISNADRVLSKTDRVRIITARALVNKPGLIFAEDVFSDLDNDTAEELLTTLFEACGNTTLIISSNQERVRSLCTKHLTLG